MHPIERLRYVARSGGVSHGVIAEEAARALAGFVDDPSGLVTACRRIVDRHPTSGPMWWLAAHVLATNDPRAEAFRCVSALQDDPTVAALAYELPDDITVTVVGWPEQVGEALVRRGDIRALVVDSLGEGSGLVRRLGAELDAGRDGDDAWDPLDDPLDSGSVKSMAVAPSHVGAAVRSSDLVILEGSAAGPDGFVGVAGSVPAAAIAATRDVDVWLVAGVGRPLPGQLWQSVVDRLHDAGEPWDRDEEVVPLSLIDRVVGPRGLETVDAMIRRADAPMISELTRRTR